MIAMPDKHFAFPPYKAEEFTPGGWAGVMNRNGFNCLTFPEKPGAVCTTFDDAKRIAAEWNEAKS